MRIPDQLKQAIICDPEILGGTPCFKGTRVPLSTFLDHIEAGISLEKFLEGYSSVQKDQAQLVLEWLSQESRKSIGIELAS